MKAPPPKKDSRMRIRAFPVRPEICILLSIRSNEIINDHEGVFSVIATVYYL